MKIKFLLFLSLLFYSFFSTAQVTDSFSEIHGDTVETIISDSSIIYIIQAAPITIVEKIEVIKTKPKPKYFLSTSFALFGFFEYKKAKPSYEEYLHKVNAATHNRFGYSIGASIWECPKKIYTGLSLDFFRLQQRFKYSNPVSGVHHSINNYFSYINLGVHLGYVIREKKNTKWILHGGIHGDNSLSSSGKTLQKTNQELLTQIKSEISYREFLMDFSVNLKFLYSVPNLTVEIEPFIMISPFSATIKKEAYSIQRSFVGIKIGFNNKLF